MAKEENKQVKKKSQPPERHRSNDFVTRYTNGVTIVITQFDIQLMFGQLIYEPDRKFAINEHTAMAMSPAHAKSLYELLGQRLKDWEKTFGPIELKKTT